MDKGSFVWDCRRHYVKEATYDGTKKPDQDLWIILLVTLAVFGLYAMNGFALMDYIQDADEPILRRLLLSASIQFGISGLGITIVCLLRKESFKTFGLESMAGSGCDHLLDVSYISVLFLAHDPPDLYLCCDLWDTDRKKRDRQRLGLCVCLCVYPECDPGKILSKRKGCLF